jgi:hypothetical protein
MIDRSLLKMMTKVIYARRPTSKTASGALGGWTPKRKIRCFTAPKHQRTFAGVVETVAVRTQVIAADEIKVGDYLFGVDGGDVDDTTKGIQVVDKPEQYFDEAGRPNIWAVML